MNNIWLLRYLGGIFLLLGLLSSAITYHPDAQWLGSVVPIFFATAAVAAFGLAAVVDRQPRSHWVHNSRPLTVCLVLFAVAVTLLLAVG
jgi:hypothetical protein